MAGNSNFAVWNTLANTKQSLSYAGFSLDKGNTRFRGTTGGTSVMSSSLSMPSGKWYIEIYSEKKNEKFHFFFKNSFIKIIDSFCKRGSPPVISTG